MSLPLLGSDKTVDAPCVCITKLESFRAEMLFLSYVANLIG
jgi:hypothetical protein